VSLFVFREYLGEDCTCRKVGAVGFDAEGFGRVGRNEGRSGSDTSLQPSECGALGLSPVPTRIVLGQVEEQVGVFQEVSDEPLVEVGEFEEGLHFLLVRQSGPLGNASDLDWVHCDGVVRDDYSEVLDCGFLEFAFVGTEVELMLLQQLQNAAGDLPVLFKGFREDEDVVQIDHNHAFRDEVLEDVVHHRLEGGRTVCEAEQHDKGLVQAAVGLEGGLPFVSFLYLDIVEAPSDVQFHEVLGSAELRNQFRNQREWVLVFHGHGIQRMVVLYQAEFSVLLFNKEDRSGHQGLGGLDPSRFEVFLQKGVQFFLFRGREWVDLATFWRSIGGELDSMVPQLGPR